MAIYRKSLDQPDDTEDFDGDGVMQTVQIGETGVMPFSVAADAVAGRCGGVDRGLKGP